MNDSLETSKGGARGGTLWTFKPPIGGPLPWEGRLPVGTFCAVSMVGVVQTSMLSSSTQPSFVEHELGRPREPQRKQLRTRASFYIYAQTRLVLPHPHGVRSRRQRGREAKKGVTSATRVSTIAVGPDVVKVRHELPSRIVLSHH